MGKALSQTQIYVDRHPAGQFLPSPFGSRDGSSNVLFLGDLPAVFVVAGFEVVCIESRDTSIRGKWSGSLLHTARTSNPKTVHDEKSCLPICI